jgi:hypothetical protein
MYSRIKIILASLANLRILCCESNNKPAQMLLVLTKGPHPHWVDQQPLKPEASATKDSDEDGFSEIFLKHSGNFKDNDNRTKLEK